MTRRRVIGLAASAGAALIAAAIIVSLTVSIKTPDPRLTGLIQRAKGAEAKKDYRLAVRLYRQILAMEPAAHEAQQRWYALAEKLNRPTPDKIRRGLWEAVKKKDAKTVRDLLDQYPQAVHARDKSGQSVLHRAAALGRPDLVELVLRRGAAAETADFFGQTPLLLAAFAGHRAVVQVLLKNGVRVNPARPGKTTALHWAVTRWQPRLAEILVNHGARLNAVDAGGRTPLHLAVLNNNPAAARWLLGKGADPARQDRAGDTALHAATAGGPIKLIEVLLAGKAPVNAVNRAGLTPLGTAVIAGHRAAADLLRRRGGRLPAQKTILFAAAEGDAAQVKKLAALRPDAVKTQAVFGQTALHLAARLGRTDAVKVLLAAGADPNSGDNLNDTPLHLAAENGRIEVVKLLLAHGARLDLQNKARQTPLQAALAAGQKKAAEIIRKKDGGR
jgi:ankyrin repeat protein